MVLDYDSTSAFVKVELWNSSSRPPSIATKVMNDLKVTVTRIACLALLESIFMPPKTYALRVKLEATKVSRVRAHVTPVLMERALGRIPLHLWRIACVWRARSGLMDLESVCRARWTRPAHSGLSSHMYSPASSSTRKIRRSYGDVSRRAHVRAANRASPRVLRPRRAFCVEIAFPSRPTD